MLSALSLGCASGPDATASDSEPTPSTTPVEYLSTTERLVRISTALRGVRPSRDELRAVEGDPESLPALVDDYLESDGFGEMVRDLFNEALNVRAGAAIYPAGFPAIGVLAGEEVERLNVSVTEAPLRLIEHVARTDRPLSEIVTADYTVADGRVAQVWGLPYPGTGDSWEVTRDPERLHAGILTDPWVFTRHSTTYSNKNRGRANTVSRALLCYDFLSRHIEIDATINLADEQEVANAVRVNEACASCHQTLDPLAAYFAGFHPIYVPSDVDSYPVEFDTPALADLFSVREPGYFGYAGGDVQYLGGLIAQDPRFSLCMAERFYAYLHQMPLSEVPLDRVAELQQALTRRWSAMDLVRAVVLADDFGVASGGEDADSRKSLFKLRPWQLARVVEDATGFRWRTRLDFEIGAGNLGLVDLMTDSLFGFEVLAGGIDSVNVTLPSHTMTSSASIVIGALAEHAADAVVESDLVNANSARLLGEVNIGETSEAAVRGQIASVIARLYGEIVGLDAAETTRAYELYREALAHSGDNARAWKTTLTAMLQDPRVLYF